MNYSKHYNTLINRSQLANRKKGHGIYYELHHIIPKCLGGSNLKENLVLLTGREHFIAHQLLTRIYPDTPKLIFALHMMTVGGINQIRNNRQYAWIKELWVARLSDRHVSVETRKKMSDSQTGKKWTTEQRTAMSLSRKGHKYNTPDVRQKIGEAHRGKITSDETKAKISISKIGTTHSKESIEKIRISSTGRPRSIDSRAKSSRSMQGQNAKYVYYIDGGIYISQGEVAFLYGIHRDTVSQRCRNIALTNWITITIDI